MDSLFDEAGERAAASAAPLAVRMRPRSLDEVVGQRHLTRARHRRFRKLVDGDAPMSLILWGPPGTGKTTLAYVVSQATKRRFTELSAVTAGVKDVRAAIDRPASDLGMSGRQTVLFIDEIHRFSKTQQDALLAAVENRWVSFVGGDHREPVVLGRLAAAVPLLLLTLQPLDEDDIRALLDRALTDPERGLAGRGSIDDDALAPICAAGGRRRPAGADRTWRPPPSAPTAITAGTLEQAVDKAAVRYDRDGDQHYDVISAFIKSMRGSRRRRRLALPGPDDRGRRGSPVHRPPPDRARVSEDVGMADPTALQVAVAAAQAVEFVGLPEARINLAQAVIHIALAPKSNAVVKAIGAAQADVRAGLIGAVPAHLRDAHYAGAQRLGHGKGYVYPHDLPEGVAAQAYAPDAVAGRAYYEPTTHGMESRYSQAYARIRAILHGPADLHGPAAGGGDDRPSEGKGT